MTFRVFDEQCSKQFNEVKKQVPSKVLGECDSKLPIVLACDASAKGVWVVIFHGFSDSRLRRKP